jgi:hypothetical protein
MAGIKVNADIKVSEFFEKTVPEFFSAQVKANPPKGLEGTEFTLDFNITGATDGKYGIKVKDASKMEVVKGGLGKALISIEVAEADFREAISGKAEGALDLFFDERMRTMDKLKALKGMAGALNMVLNREGAGPINVRMVFNNSDSTKSKLTMKIGDYADIVSGRSGSVAAFMGGKMKHEGSMPFIMKLGMLLG